MATTVFDLRAILASSIETAIDLARKSENVTVEQVMEQVMASVNIQQIEIVPVKTKTARARETKAASAADEPKEKIERVRAAPAKPRGIPEGDVRCCARSLYEKDHLEGGKPKVMRDDEANLYGDRCKFKKVGETEFCKHHAEKQPLGVWGAEYSGKFHTLVQKLNAPAEEPKPKVVKEAKPKAAAEEDKPKAAKEDKPKTEKPAKKSKVAAEVCELTEEEPETPATEPVVEQPKAAKEDKPKAAKEDKPKAAKEDKPKAAKVEQPKAAPAPATKPVAPEPAEDEEVAEVEECEIDGKTYLRDNEGTIYDMESEEEVGQYNFNTKKWIKRA
jgi:hypothetical protein